MPENLRDVWFAVLIVLMMPAYHCGGQRDNHVDVTILVDSCLENAPTLPADLMLRLCRMRTAHGNPFVLREESCGNILEEKGRGDM